MLAVLTSPPAFRQRLVTGVGDLAVSRDPSAILSTYSLGSCIAVAAYEPALRAGGLLHLMLPDASIAPDKALRQPALFADTGIPLLLRGMDGLGCERAALRFLFAGGASVLAGADPFRIGERNARAVADILAREGCSVQDSLVGGSVNRAVHLDLWDGSVTVTTPSDGRSFSLAAQEGC